MGEYYITPVLRDLHWLPVEQRIRFKIVAITYKIIENVTVPIYLTDLVDLRVPQRSTRQSSKIRLEPPPVNSIMTKYDGNRTFSVVASTYGMIFHQTFVQPAAMNPLSHWSKLICFIRIMVVVVYFNV